MNTNQSIKRTAFTRVFQKPQVTADVQPAAGGGWGADGYEEAVALDMRWREIDDWSAERSPRLAVRSSRLRQPNAQLCLCVSARRQVGIDGPPAWHSAADSVRPKHEYAVSDFTRKDTR
jgi:hypothetical protein